MNRYQAGSKKKKNQIILECHTPRNEIQNEGEFFLNIKIYSTAVVIN